MGECRKCHGTTVSAGFYNECMSCGAQYKKRGTGSRTKPIGYGGYSD